MINNLEFQKYLKEKGWLDGAGVIMSVKQFNGIPNDPIFLNAAKEIEEKLNSNNISINHRYQAKHCMLNLLPPNTIVPIHTDPCQNGLKYQRYHYPIQTNDQSFFIQLIEKDNTKIEKAISMQANQWYGPIRYWEPHYVKNLHPTEPRIHLIIDLL